LRWEITTSGAGTPLLPWKLKIGKPVCRQAGEKLKVAFREENPVWSGDTPVPVEIGNVRSGDTPVPVKIGNVRDGDALVPVASERLPLTDNPVQA